MCIGITLSVPTTAGGISLAPKFARRPHNILSANIIACV